MQKTKAIEWGIPNQKLLINIGMFIASYAFFSCNGAFNKQKTENPIDSPKVYHNLNILEIDHSSFEKTYVDAKWRLYCMYCDSPVVLPGLSALYVGELTLDLALIRDSSDIGYLNIKNPKQLLFLATHKDTTIKSYYDFLIFTKKTDFELKPGFYYGSLVYSMNKPEEPIMIEGYGCGGYSIRNIADKNIRKQYYKSRQLYPLQPEVIYFVREHQNKINPWFLEEAKKRGVFDSSKYPPNKIKKSIEVNRKEKNKVKSWQEYLQ